MDNEKLVTVAERPHELAASILVAALAEEGIRAIAVGGFTAGFVAEAPGWVKVQVMQSDAERARQIIADIENQ